MGGIIYKKMEAKMKTSPEEVFFAVICFIALCIAFFPISFPIF
jgi:hypothetical protein